MDRFVVNYKEKDGLDITIGGPKEFSSREAQAILARMLSDLKEKEIKYLRDEKKK